MSSAIQGPLVVDGDLFVVGESTTENDLAIKAYGGPGAFHGYAAAGSKNNPLPLSAGAMLLGIGGRPFGVDGFSDHSACAIHMIAREDTGGGKYGSSFRILVTPLACSDADRIESIRFESDGKGCGTRWRFSGNEALKDRAYFQSRDGNNPNSSIGVLPFSDGGNAAVNVFSGVKPESSKFGQLIASPEGMFISSGAPEGKTPNPVHVSFNAEIGATFTKDKEFLVNTNTSNGAHVTIKQTPGVKTALRLETPASEGTLAVFSTSLGLAGSIFASGTSISLASLSDYRIKKDVVPTPSNVSWGVIREITPVSFTIKSTGEKCVGFIAHEFQKVLPKWVTGVKDGRELQQLSAANNEVLAHILNVLKDIDRRLLKLESR